MQADTVVPAPGNPQALNRYAYAANNPLRYADPTGRFTEDELLQHGVVSSRDELSQLKEDNWQWYYLLSAAVLGDRFQVELNGGVWSGQFYLGEDNILKYKGIRWPFGVDEPVGRMAPPAQGRYTLIQSKHGGRILSDGQAIRDYVWSQYRPDPGEDPPVHYVIFEFGGYVTLGAHGVFIIDHKGNAYAGLYGGIGIEGITASARGGNLGIDHFPSEDELATNLGGWGRSYSGGYIVGLGGMRSISTQTWGREFGGMAPGVNASIGYTWHLGKWFPGWVRGW